MTRAGRASGVVGTSADGRHDLVVHRTGVAPGPQGRLALAVLVVERRALTREHLARLVRDDAPPDACSLGLSSVLSTARRLVSRAGPNGRAVVSSAGGSCGIRLPAGSGVDLEDTERRTDRAQGAPRHGDAAAAARDAAVASAVLRRPFLPGVAGEWAEGPRVAPSPETSVLVEGLR